MPWLICLHPWNQLRLIIEHCVWCGCSVVVIVFFILFYFIFFFFFLTKYHAYLFRRLGTEMKTILKMLVLFFIFQAIKAQNGEATLILLILKYRLTV